MIKDDSIYYVTDQDNLHVNECCARVSTQANVQGSISVTNTSQTFTAAQRGTITTLTDFAIVTPDFAITNTYKLELGGNRTLANPTNLAAGQSGVIVIRQDSTGSRTLAFGGYWKYAGGTAPTLTTTTSASDVIVYFVDSATRIPAQVLRNLS